MNDAENTPAVETLKDEQIEKALQTGEMPEATPAPADPAPQDTPQTAKPGEAKVDDKPPAPTATDADKPAGGGEKNPDGTLKTATTEKMYAGKYKTTDELKKGLLEIAKPLNYNAKILEKLVQLAEKNNDWTSVEEAYQELKLTLDRNQKAEADRKVAEEKAQIETPSPADTELARQQEAQVVQVIQEETVKALANSAVLREMRELGLDIPKNAEEWKKMQSEYPYLAIKFENAYLSTMKKFMNEAKEYQTALHGAEAHNAKAKESAKQQIGEFVKKYELPVDDAAIEAIIAEAEQSAFANEMKAGVPYLREGGIFKYFLAERFPELEKAIKLKAESTGRTQAVDDLKTMHDKTTSTISTVTLPGNRPKDGPKVDLENEQEIAALSDEKLEQLLKGKT